MRKRSSKALIILGILLVGAIILVLPQGRYPVGLGEMWHAFMNWAGGEAPSPEDDQIIFLFVHVRLPRIIAALLVGAALSVSGAVYQNMFMNPLVSPGILGVQQGASFGAAIGIVVFSSWPLTQMLSFAGGLAGVGLSLFFSLLYPKARTLALVVGGLVSSSFFMALASILKYVADPNKQLPELVYWLMGTLSRAELVQLYWVGPAMLLGLAYLCLHGKTLNILSMGDDEARSLGIASWRYKLQFVGVATLLCSLTVVLAGVINWVGLVIPHVMRFITGPDNRPGLPAAAMGGALFVLLTDTLVRTVWTAELPLGIATSIIAMPIFAFSLWYDWKRR